VGLRFSCQIGRRYTNNQSDAKRSDPAVLQAKVSSRLTFEMLENTIRNRSYGVLSTISREGRPHSAGVSYAVSDRTEPFGLYIVTDGRSKKARNITRNPQVSFVIPVPRWFGFLPPSSIQFEATAAIIPLSDETSRMTFERSFITKRILSLQLAQKSEVSTFIRVRPSSVMFTYGVGLSIFQLMKHVEGAAARVEIPPGRI